MNNTPGHPLKLEIKKNNGCKSVNEANYIITRKQDFKKDPFNRVKILVYPNRKAVLKVVKKKGWKDVQQYLKSVFGGQENQMRWEIELEEINHLLTTNLVDTARQQQANTQAITQWNRQ
ncbi:hypothetical protein H6G33_36315 [Calothrix sp. FACHB-1219]|uniref:hypothetical protein n=1 Tax=unclassified Calothrix TaxID=2619626 RepID=UPI001682FDC7|nr:MULTISPECIES: hypothetical protein [unclassified Calothrix]MBD2207777.1 hypothetical protein [Calothrix sp. FACHB-168]MBD2222397.1 hypothetical protein [Calothrix sp. FACHB-1219]